MTKSTQPQSHNFIDGEEVGGSLYPIFNPARFEDVIGLGERADAALVDQAAEAADRAAGPWGQAPLDLRVSTLRAAYEALQHQANSEDCARLLTLEQGKVLAESRLELELAQRRIQFAIDIASDALSDQVFEEASGRRISLFEPLGVVAVITPWNWPVHLTVSKVVPAILAGNAVVAKPAPNTPLAVTQVITALGRALPPGVLNVIHGEADVGAALVQHPEVRKVNFTGSVASGRKVYAAASGTVKNLTLELGGNDAAIVLDDARFTPEAIDAMLAAIFTTSGQVCMAIKRIYVHEARHDDLRQALIEGAGRYIVGDGMQRGVTMGPLNNRAQYERVLDLASAARASGARITAVGSRDPGVHWDRGYFVQPAIVTDVDDSAPLAAEEQFGPLIPLLPFKSDDEALERSNNSEYGLTGSVWGGDLDRAQAVARGLSAGLVSVNAHGLASLSPRQAIGGVKQSGLGRQGGIEGMRNFTSARHIQIRSPR